MGSPPRGSFWRAPGAEYDRLKRRRPPHIILSEAYGFLRLVVARSAVARTRANVSYDPQWERAKQANRALGWCNQPSTLVGLTNKVRSSGRTRASPLRARRSTDYLRLETSALSSGSPLPSAADAAAGALDRRDAPGDPGKSMNCLSRGLSVNRADRLNGIG